MAYTRHDTPSVTRRLDADMAHVVTAVRLADPHLRSLILTGGFARGEGMMHNGAPQNDYDLVAVRGFGPPREAYAAVRRRLERELGLHIDLASVAAWRLRRAPASVFWYETALRGRVLWGEDLLPDIPVRAVEDIDAKEGLRLLVNRAAGLLLATDLRHPHDVRIQACKAILAAFDVHMLAAGRFAPSQTGRWHEFQRLLVTGPAPAALQADDALFTWAFRFKTDPASVDVPNPDDVWIAARRVLLQAVPVALQHAGLASLDAYGRTDRLVDRVLFALRAHRVEGVRRFVLHPTGQVRVATLRLLEATGQRRVDAATARLCLARAARVGNNPLETLSTLRGATRQ